jgi:hypothetical protein
MMLTLLRIGVEAIDVAEEDIFMLLFEYRRTIKTEKPCLNLAIVDVNM